MTKGKICGLSSFTYDVKNKQTGMKTGEQKTLGKVFVMYDDSENGVEGTACGETLVDVGIYEGLKINQEVFVAKFGGRLQISV